MSNQWNSGCWQSGSCQVATNALTRKVQAEITVVTQAKAQAESVKAHAAAEAECNGMKGEAEAAAIKAKGMPCQANLVGIDQSGTLEWCITTDDVAEQCGAVY